MIDARIMAMRGRSNGDWHTSQHYQKIEVGGDTANSITSVAKDNYVIEIIKDMAKKTDKSKINLPEQLRGKKIRIRKLTPRECFRLMGVDDKDIDKIQAYPYETLIEHPAYSKEERLRGMTDKEKRAAMKRSISNSAQYKLAGNSIVVDVLFHLFRKLFIETQPDAGEGTLF